MTVYKRHTRDDGTVGPCEAEQGGCKYANNPHGFYDPSIKKEVLDPNSSAQRSINRLPVEELHSLYSEKDIPDYGTAHADYVKADTEYQKQVESVAKTYPVKNQEFVSQLLKGTKDAPSVLNYFEVKHLPDTFDFATDEKSEKARIDLAAAHLRRDAAADKVRAQISAHQAVRTQKRELV
jgi:hypothetical protein